ncbi:MAG: hypothetical protein AB9872_04575 [Solidesulfovibrio sp.]
MVLCLASSSSGGISRDDSAAPFGLRCGPFPGLGYRESEPSLYAVDVLGIRFSLLC